MRSHSTSTRINKLVAVLILFVLVFSQFVGQANAQGPTPPLKKKFKSQQPAWTKSRTTMAASLTCKGTLAWSSSLKTCLPHWFMHKAPLRPLPLLKGKLA